MADETKSILVRITTPSGSDGFFEFVPPQGTVEIKADVFKFLALDKHGCGPTISAKRAGICQAAVVFMSDDELMTFSDYVVRAGGTMTAAYQQQKYRTTLDQWAHGLM